MIDQLSITNYQSHSKSVFDFDKGVNVIVGRTDSGKSAIIRALNWVISNKPKGDSFITNGTKQTTVSIKTEGKTVTRVKSKKDNYYLIDNEKYETITQDTLDSVQKVINMGEINSQFQMDSSFLLSQTPGEIARYFNKVANLEIMDSTLKKLASTKKIQEQDSVRIGDQIVSLNKQIEDFGYLDEADKLVSKGEELEKELETLSFNCSELETEIRRVTELKDQFDEFENTEKDKELVENCLILIDSWDKIEQEKQQLQEVVYEVTQKNKVYSSLEREVTERKVKLKKIMPKICPLCEQIIKS